jgi:hypothetical protein
MPEVRIVRGVRRLKIFPEVRYGDIPTSAETLRKYRGSVVVGLYSKFPARIILARVPMRFWARVHTLCHELTHHFLEITVNRIREDWFDDLFDRVEFRLTCHVFMVESARRVRW